MLLVSFEFESGQLLHVITSSCICCCVGLSRLNRRLRKCLLSVYYQKRGVEYGGVGGRGRVLVAFNFANCMAIVCNHIPCISFGQ